MINWPKPLSNLSIPFVAWANRLLATARQCTPISIEGYRIEQGTDGFRARKNFQTSGGTSGKTLDANYKMMAIKALGSSLVPPIPDLLICSSVDMSSGSPAIRNDSVYVAKARTMRRITNEFFYDNGANVTQQYAYFGPTSSDGSYGDNFRQASDGVQAELEVVVPRYYTAGILQPPISKEQSFVFVVDLGFPTGVVDPTGANVNKVEVLPARMWSKVVNA